MSFLSKDINKNIKNLNIRELEELSGEIREKIIQTATDNGGHLSSNLGIVETTVALYKYFDFPSDKIVFDVGHQCYAHKILSDRLDSFSSIRQEGGLSGFPNARESEFDNFTVGHAGTSLSTALGLCEARDKLKKDHYVVAVVGDGAIVNGLNLEALSEKNEKPKKLIVILNDNGMSISKNQNGLYQYISKRTLRKGYINGKRAIKKVFGSSFVTSWLTHLRNFIKRIIYKEIYFEKFGFKYVGIVDGNNLKELSKILPKVKETAKDKAVLLYVKTTKGKGYLKAEERSDAYHGVGKNLVNSSGSFGNALGVALNAEIDKNDKIVAITAGMKDGTGLKQVEDKHPDNFHDVGIAEEYALSLSAGLAKGGLKPVVAIYSTFMQRGYDQIVHDICLNNLPVVMCLDRAGFVGEDGETHQGLFDLSFLNHIPNLTVLTPTSSFEIADTLSYALSLNSPVAIRYPKNDNGEVENVKFDKDGLWVENVKFDKDGLWQELKSGTDGAILAVGPNAVSVAVKVSEAVDRSLSVVAVKQVKPLNIGFLNSLRGKTVVTIEENSLIGGFGSEVARFYSNDKNTEVFSFGAKDNFVSHGKIYSQLVENGIDYTEITNIMMKGNK